MTEEAAGAAEDAAVPARPRRLHLHPPLPRPVRHRRVRAERQADRAVGGADRPASPSSGRTGTTSRRSLAAARQRVPGARVDRLRPLPARRRRASRPTRTSSSGSCPSSTGCSSRPASTRRGSSSAPGVGRAAAEWIVEGHPTMDLDEVDVARMERWMNQPAWLHERTVESLGGLYELHWPGKQPRTGRDVRRVPLVRLVPRGRGRVRAGGGMGARQLVRARRRGSGGPLRLRGAVVVPVGARGGPCDARGRRAVRPLDLREVRRRWPRGARRAFSGWRRPTWTSSRADRLHAPVQRARRYRDGPDDHPARRGSRSLSSPRPSTQRRTEALLRRGLPPRAPIVTDVTSELATLHLAGPRSRELLARLTDADVSAAAWPFLQARRDRGRGVRGLGVPRLVHRGAGLGAVGADRVRGGPVRADRSGRRRPRPAPRRRRSRSTPRALERGFRSWGHDLGPLVRSVRVRARVRGLAPEGRRLRRPRQRSSGCAARRARAASGQRPRPRSPCCGTASRCSATASEPATSRAPRSRRPWAARPAWAGSTARSTATWQVEIGGEPVPCRVSLDPFYDPRGERLRELSRSAVARVRALGPVRRRPRRRSTSDARPCGRSGRRRRSGCGRAGRRARRAGRCR